MSALRVDGTYSARVHSNCARPRTRNAARHGISVPIGEMLLIDIQGTRKDGDPFEQVIFQRATWRNEERLLSLGSVVLTAPSA